MADLRLQIPLGSIDIDKATAPQAGEVVVRLPAATVAKIEWGCSRSGLYLAPITQDFELLLW